MIYAVVFLLGVIVGAVIMGLCEDAYNEPLPYNGLIPIDYGEPMLNSHCIVQITGQLGENIKAYSAIFMADYTDEGWIIDGFEEAEDFDVEAWCYSPDPIKET